MLGSLVRRHASWGGACTAFVHRRRALGVHGASKYMTTLAPAVNVDQWKSNVKMLDEYFRAFPRGEEKISAGGFEMTVKGLPGRPVIMSSGGTVVQATCVPVVDSDFGKIDDEVKLVVTFREKYYASGIIPKSFGRTEPDGKDANVLIGRLIDRSLRPLLKEVQGYEELQVVCTVLSYDPEHDNIDVLALNAASMAVSMACPSWGGPVGALRAGTDSETFVVASRGNSRICMIEGGSNKTYTASCSLDNPTFMGLLEQTVERIGPLVDLQNRLLERLGSNKCSWKKVQTARFDPQVLEVARLAAGKLADDLFTIGKKSKMERAVAQGKFWDASADLMNSICESKGIAVSKKDQEYVLGRVLQGSIRKLAFNGKRPDGRGVDEVRPISGGVRVLPIVHGSSIFTRGDTQVLCSVTAGPPADVRVDMGMRGEFERDAIVHYSFPPYCVGRTGRVFNIDLREVGHGMLAEKALSPVFHSTKTERFTYNMNSEVTGSDGSSSMATVCGLSLALADIGSVEGLSEHIGGVSMGMHVDGDDFVILTDCLGMEDHFGAMDFKIAGTRDAITCIQMDIKVPDVSLEMVEKILEKARLARGHIIDEMDKIRDPKEPPGVLKRHPCLMRYTFSNHSEMLAVVRRLEEVERGIKGVRFKATSKDITIFTLSEGDLKRVKSVFRRFIDELTAKRF
mmetsp:Transcript_24133/g.39072  ORF Transcript_24133/g.39072 Transcript_24133/m.39072 type:complete len:683 (+) Transcript_24133:237-2285(+)